MNDTTTLGHLDGSEIAIIGMSCRFPGAQDLATYWRNLRDGVESISQLTNEEIQASGVDPALFQMPNYVKAAPVLEAIDMFDAGFFGYTPREAEFMDPQQRLFLECAWHALEHAGYDPDRYDDAIGVYTGARTSMYMFNLFSNPDLLRSLDITEVGIGNDLANLATRISYKFNLRGPSYALHTACSTSLVAVHLACQSLLIDECQMALAGGVAVNVPQKVGYAYQHGGILSPDGHCRPFDANAQGTLFGSGLGLVVLKRLEDALEDGDTVYAIIRGTASNNDGSSKASFTAPGVDGQVDVIAEALANAGVRPESLSYIEAHGTGTTLGDSIEIRALTKAFRATTEKQGYCAIGSVKSNLGHLDTAAGISSLIKTVLALQHHEIPPTLHLETPNPALENSPFYVNTQLTPWKTNDQPRRAGVSSFGFGSANAHIVLEEAPEPIPTTAAGRSWQLVTLSARTDTALDAATINLANHLQEHPTHSFADVTYTLQVGRREFDHRRVLVCQDRDEAMQILSSGASQHLLTATATMHDRPVIFMFSGQGAQYVHMGRDLYYNEALFRTHVDRCAELLLPHLGRDLRDLLYPPDDQVESATSLLDQTWLTQPALFVVEYALAQLWMSWGIQPHAMIGHSIGEYVAACLAGVFALEDALRLVVTRGRMMQEAAEGAMLAVPLSEQAIMNMLNGEVTLAAINGPTQCTVAGPLQAIETLQSQLAAQEIDCRRLHTSHAFHSTSMDPFVEPFTAEVRTVQLHTPNIPYLSNVTGMWMTDEDATAPEYWGRHLRQSVQFASGIRELLTNPHGILLEVGPGQTLSTFARQQIDPTSSHTVLSSLRHPRETQSDQAFLLTALGKLWLAGATIDWPALYRDEHRRRVPLPTYPFERQRYWIDAEPGGLGGARQTARVGKNPDVGDWFYLPSWKRSLLPTSFDLAKLADKPRRWLVFTDQSGVGKAIVQRLRDAQQTVVTVDAAQHFAKIDDTTYTIHPSQSADYAALLHELHNQGFDPQTIVHLWNISPVEDSTPSLQSLEHTQEQGLYSLLCIAHVFGEHYTQEPIHITVASTGVYDVSGMDSLSPAKSPILGPCRVIPQEHPNVTCQNIDIKLPEAGTWQETQLIDVLTTELAAIPTDTVIAYRGANRWVQSYEATAVTPNNITTRLRERGVYLITGGLGGIGQIMANHLAKTVQARLILTGRSPFPQRSEWDAWIANHDEQNSTSQKIRQVQALETNGAEVLVLQADVSDTDQMHEVVEHIYTHFGALHGVIHAAGLVGEKSFMAIQETGQDECQMHLQPKAYGTMVLEQILQEKTLDFCLLLSSLSTVLGGLWASAYAGANAFMDALAYQHNQRSTTPWISVNWDAWQFGEEQGDNIVTGSTLADLVILPDEGADAFQRVLSLGPISQVVVSTGDLQTRLDQWVKLGALQQTSTGNGAAGSRHERPNLQTPYVAPRNEYEEKVAEMWQQVLGIEQVGIFDDFFELGGHSLLITQLLNKIHKVYPIEIAMRSLFEQPTVAGIAALIEQTYQRHEDGSYRPIREQIRDVSPEERQDLLEGYLRTKVAEALSIEETAIPDDGDLSTFDLETITGDVQWFCQQDFKLQVYPHEIPRLQSISAMACFLAEALDRLTTYKTITTTAPLSLYEEYEAQVSRQFDAPRPTRKPAVKRQSMVFVHASPRSGSTLFRVMLAGHPHLCAPPELGVLWYDTMGDWHRSLTDPDYGHGFHWAAQGLQWTLSELMGVDGDTAKAFMDDLIADNTPIEDVYDKLQHLVQPRVLIDKSPSYGMSLTTLRRAEDLFSGAKYVHLVRHPYSMIESFVRIRLDRLFAPVIYGTEDVDPHVVAEKVWVTCNGNVRALLEQVDPARHHTIRYEDLVSNPEQTMRRLCDFLEIPFDRSVIQPYDDKRERMITGIGDPNILQHDNVDAQLGEVWRKIRLPHQLGIPARELAESFAYELPAEEAPTLSEDGLQHLVDTTDADTLAHMMQQIEQLSPEEAQKLLNKL